VGDIDFEDPADLGYFESITDGSRAEQNEWIIYPAGAATEPSPDGRVTETGVLNQVTDNVKDDLLLADRQETILRPVATLC
jgi:hypothetical protein